MKRSKPKFSRSRAIIAFIIVLVLGYAAGFFLGFKRPITINQISAPSTAYGNVTLAGTIQKDAPIAQSGDYLLVSPTASYVVLNFADPKLNADPLIGIHVQASGVLIPPSATSHGHNILLVQTIETKP